MKKAKVLAVTALAIVLASCASDTKNQNRAKEAAARYWSDKAYPGKSYDVQVISAEKTDDGTYRVKGIVDGETRVGQFSPQSETFSEGYYSVAHEREKRIAELEQQVKYWKEQSEAKDKEIYKLKFQLSMGQGGQGQGTAAGVKPASVPASEEKH
jgi:hypothetical protein